MQDLKEERIIKEAMISKLPEPVQRYMNFTGVVGKPWIRNVELGQNGKFRLSIDRPWMPMSARQIFYTNPPSFLWKARFRMGGIPLLSARDEYSAGQARMVGRLAGLISIFDVRGEKLDQGAMLRYLGEMIWFPTAYLGDNITWEAIDDTSSKVTFNDAGKSVSGRMFFDQEGKPTNFTAKRYRETDGDFSLDDWSTPIVGYETHADLNLPTHAQAVWNLPSGDLKYVELEVDDIRYNTAA